VCIGVLTLRVPAKGSIVTWEAGAAKAKAWLQALQAYAGVVPHGIQNVELVGSLGFVGNVSDHVPGPLTFQQKEKEKKKKKEKHRGSILRKGDFHGDKAVDGQFRDFGA
jgi:hypothetical protein